MSASRERILGRLRAAQTPFPEVDAPPAAYRPVVPMDHAPDADALVTHFVAEARAIGCIVTEAASPSDAIEALFEVLADDKTVMAWDATHIPLPGLDEALAAHGVARTTPRDASARVGLTGVDVGAASTGTLVLSSGPGRPRAASLLPLVHVAIVTRAQVVPHLEAWLAGQRAAGLPGFDASNTVLISGPSRTADIAMELILGMHGPREVHMILLA